MNIRSTRWARPLALGSAAFVLIVAAACGGDGDNGNGDGNGDGATAEPTETMTAEPTPTETADAPSTPDATGTAGNGGGEGDEAAAGDLADLASMFENASFTVTYQMSSDLEGQGMEGEWTWYLDAEGNRSRFDIDGIDASMPGTMTVITTPEETVLCFDGACLGGDMPGVSDPSGELFDQVDSVDDYATSGNVRSAGTRSIGGVDAECYEFDNPEVDIETGTLCFSAEGVPLLAEWSAADGTFSMEATAYSNSVSDADFEPPFPVMAIPTN